MQNENQNPDWWVIEDVCCVDLNHVVGVTTWSYTRDPSTPTGLKFVLIDGKQLDTPEMGYAKTMRLLKEVIDKLTSKRGFKLGQNKT